MVVPQFRAPDERRIRPIQGSDFLTAMPLHMLSPNLLELSLVFCVNKSRGRPATITRCDVPKQRSRAPPAQAAAVSACGCWGGHVAHRAAAGKRKPQAGWRSIQRSSTSKAAGAVALAAGCTQCEAGDAKAGRAARRPSAGSAAFSWRPPEPVGARQGDVVVPAGGARVAW